MKRIFEHPSFSEEKTLGRSLKENFHLHEYSTLLIPTLFKPFLVIRVRRISSILEINMEIKNAVQSYTGFSEGWRILL